MSFDLPVCSGAWHATSDWTCAGAMLLEHGHHLDWVNFSQEFF